MLAKRADFYFGFPPLPAITKAPRAVGRYSSGALLQEREQSGRRGTRPVRQAFPHPASVAGLVGVLSWCPPSCQQGHPVWPQCWHWPGSQGRAARPWAEPRGQSCLWFSVPGGLGAFCLPLSGGGEQPGCPRPISAQLFPALPTSDPLLPSWCWAAEERLQECLVLGCPTSDPCS